MRNMNKTKVLSKVTGLLLALLGTGAVAAGGGLIAEPGGESLGMTLNLLRNTPFENLLIPGIVLFVIIGLPSLIGAHFAFKEHRNVGILTMILGLAMIVLVGLETYWAGWVNWMQPTFLGVGVLEMGVGYFLNRLHVENHGMFTFRHHTHAH